MLFRLFRFFRCLVSNVKAYEMLLRDILGFISLIQCLKPSGMWPIFFVTTSRFHRMLIQVLFALSVLPSTSLSQYQHLLCQSIVIENTLF